MKKLFLILLVGGSLIACQENANRNTPIRSEPTTPVQPEDITVAYVPMDGDVIYKDNQLMVYKDGQWAARDEKVILNNGAVVYTNGVVKKDEKAIQLQDGEIISGEGNIFDKAGQKIENAWKDTKEAVKDAGNEIEKGAKKAGNKIDDAVDPDRDRK